MREKTVIALHPNPVRPDSLESDPSTPVFPVAHYYALVVLFP